MYHNYITCVLHMFVQNRPKGGLNEEKLYFAKEHAPLDTLAEVVKSVKPDAIIGNNFLSNVKCS